ATNGTEHRGGNQRYTQNQQAVSGIHGRHEIWFLGAAVGPSVEGAIAPPLPSTRLASTRPLRQLCFHQMSRFPAERSGNSLAPARFAQPSGFAGLAAIFALFQRLQEGEHVAQLPG